MMVEQDHYQSRSDHIIIENTNVFSTPDQKGMMVFCKCNVPCGDVVGFGLLGNCRNTHVSVFHHKKIRLES